MKKQYIRDRKNPFSNTKIWMAFILSIVVFVSCEQQVPDNIVKSGPIELSASSEEIVLNQKNYDTDAFKLNWTTGTNNGTGASISYLLQIDKQGNNFSAAINFDKGKAIYEQNFNVADLNDKLLNYWNIPANTQSALEARVITTVYSTPQVKDTSNVVIINVTPYQPVTNTLYIIGDASPYGWDANKAIALTPKEDNPTEFVFQGALGVGSFKFITTLGQFLPSYNKGATNEQLFYRTLDSEPDDKFNIAEAAVYKITVELPDMSIAIEKVDLPAYNELYIVGSATPIGWNIADAIKLVQSTSNPYIFTYTGVLLPGEFKFPVNRNTDWAQDMYMRTDDSHMYLHKGGDSDDNKWAIEKKGFYILTLNLSDNTIDIHREKLYMVGSATPIGWSIDKAIEMTEDDTDGCIFKYTGPMVAGEFKFPVNRNTDWGQDMYMRVDDENMYRHVGGSPDDNKWNITVDGNYEIIANIETLKLSFIKK
ncbi:conserved hypothetical protein [uncultured Paludibacter sp.]|uniref:SusE outer membrane protein domain-containing protein n=1 Tax=uncultured Paludibacter sp. TaxID=497635 RepID=A0A653AKZ8_9BACT|nr:conserved hypothetical protein [uncultured Paludibacter sp.]